LNKFERRILFATWAGVAAAAITGVFIYSQFKIMSDQTQILGTQTINGSLDSIEAGRRIEKQLAIAQQQTNAAQDSVKAIQRQMRQDQRAWIDIALGNFQWSLNAPVAVPVVITNMGKTPAQKFRAIVVVEVLKIDKSPDLGSTLKVPAVSDTAGIMTPRSVATLTGETLMVDPSDKKKVVPWILDEARKLDLESGNTYWVARGMIWYDDIFKTPHWRKFCTFGSPKIGIQLPTGACSQYNRVDDK
jgi:hypothetical protein